MFMAWKQCGHEIYQSNTGSFLIITKTGVKDFLELSKAVVWALFNPKP